MAARGFSRADLRAVAASATNGKLHGRVLLAWQAKQEADTAPPPQSDPSTDEAAPSAGRSVLVRLDAVKAEKVSWLGAGRVPRCHTDTCAGDCCTFGGKVYRQGDRLPDGRPVLSVDPGIPVLGRRS